MKSEGRRRKKEGRKASTNVVWREHLEHWCTGDWTGTGTGTGTGTRRNAQARNRILWAAWKVEGLRSSAL